MTRSPVDGERGGDAGAMRREDGLFAKLAHEMRNPIACIGAAASLLRESGDEAHRRWAVELIERQNDHMRRLVEDLMDASSLGRGKLRIEKHRIDLGEVIAGAAAAVRPLLAVRGHSLEIALSLRQAKPVERRKISKSETFRWNPAGNQSRLAEPGQQPEASLAWRRGDPPCEA